MRSKSRRPTKRIQKQLDSLDAQMKKLSDHTPIEEENDLEHLTEFENDLGEHTESEITASILLESVIEEPI